MWKVEIEPVGDNPGSFKNKFKRAVKGEPTEVDENTGGLVIYLVNGDGRREEVSAVSFVRRISRNPDRSFKEQMDLEVAKAYAAVETLNSVFDEPGTFS